MATRIRLQRHGHKGYAFYHIVIADSRAPRDGKFIERIGSYNPNTDPATIDLNFDRALYWVQTGAQPSDTVRNILSGQGVYMKKHLLGGVSKGAFNEEEAEKRFQTWLDAKQANVSGLKEKNDKEAKERENLRLKAEEAVNKKKADALAEKRAAIAKAEAEEVAKKIAEEKAENEPAVAEASNNEAESPKEEKPAKSETEEEVKA